MVTHKRKLIEVTWVDSTSYRGWRPQDGIEDAPMVECKSVGYLFKKGRNRIVLTQSMSDDNDVSEVLVIPRKAVINFRELRGDED